MSYNNYHKPSSSYSSGVSRGRGFSTRGSYRGRGDSGGSWSTGTSRGRGFSGPSRGRFNWYKESTGFDSRNRYTSGSSGAERYSSRGRGDDSGYRRYSRGEVADYSPRDHSHHRSPESQRKRMRTDHGYVQASSTRRSHEGGYGGGTDYNSRYNSYSEDKGGYGEERGRGYREERRSTGFRDRSREDYPHRKPEALDSSMPPPSSAPPLRHVSSPRGSFRGRLSSRGTRGMSRMMLARRADTLLARKRSMMDSSYTVRKRILTARTQADSLRRLKIQRLRRLREAAASKKDGKDKDGAISKATEDISDEEEKEETWEEEEEKGDDDEELEEGETPDKKEKVKKIKKDKTVSKDEEPEEGEEIDDEEDEIEDDEEDEEKADVKNNGGVHITIKQDSDARDVSEEGRKPRTTYSGRPFIRLSCPHCFIRCITFKEYSMHLYSSKHINAMRKQSLRHKQTLARMRMTQRQKQRVVEETEEVHGSLSDRTKFCPICKLNYRQLKSKHQISEYHRAMRKFLMPYCRICRLGFKSPMLYENHICSLDHIKRKARVDETVMRLHMHAHDRSRNEDDGSGMEDDDKELNMDNFMILDSVGTVDDAGDDGETDGEGKGKSDKERKEGEEKKSKSEINLGAEYIKKVEVYYCELCRLYLPRLDQPERSLAIHCRTRTHLQRYVRYRDDRALRKEAERIHRKEMAKENAEKEAETKKSVDEKKDQSNEKMDEDKDGVTEKDGKKSTEDAGGEKKKDEAGSEASQGESKAGDLSSETVGEPRGADGDGEGDLDQDLEAGMDDKLWADVDKDLGELLREVEPGNKSSDEDEDSRAEGGRYDRFRYSEKGSSVAATAAAVDPPSEGDAPASKAAAEVDEKIAEPADTDDAAKETKKPAADPKPETESPAKKAPVATSTPSAPATTATN